LTSCKTVSFSRCILLGGMSVHSCLLAGYEVRTIDTEVMIRTYLIGLFYFDFVAFPSLFKRIVGSCFKINRSLLYPFRAILAFGDLTTSADTSCCIATPIDRGCLTIVLADTSSYLTSSADTSSYLTSSADTSSYTITTSASTSYYIYTSGTRPRVAVALSGD
jgi:hypothetical protein